MWNARFLLFPFPAALTERNALVHFDFLNMGVLVSDADADIGGFSLDGGVGRAQKGCARNSRRTFLGNGFSPH